MTRLLLVLSQLLRLFVGVVLIGTGVGKGLDLPGFVDVIGTYQLLPDFTHWPTAVGMTGFEIVLGVWLLVGRQAARAGLVSAALHASFTAWAVIALLRGLDIPNCGCFGVFLARPLTWATPVEDAVMIALSLGIFVLARKLKQTDTQAQEGIRMQPSTIVSLLVSALAASCATTQVAKSDVNADDLKGLTAFDYSGWTKLTTTLIDTKGEVDYVKLQAERSELDRFVATLALVGPKTRPELFPTKESQFAYYINAYNAFTMFNVVNRYPAIKSVTEEQLSFFVTTKFKMDGTETNLYDLENKIVRPMFNDPRGHFALNCASAGCPILPNEPFLPETLEAQLAREANDFLHETRNVAVVDGKVVLSNIFDWYKADFGDDPVAWIRAKAPDLNLPDTKAYEIRPYDWALNDQNR